MDCIHVAQDNAPVYSKDINVPSSSTKCGELFDQQKKYKTLIKSSASCRHL